MNLFEPTGSENSGTRSGVRAFVGGVMLSVSMQLGAQEIENNPLPPHSGQSLTLARELLPDSQRFLKLRGEYLQERSNYSILFDHITYKSDKPRLEATGIPHLSWIPQIGYIYIRKEGDSIYFFLFRNKVPKNLTERNIISLKSVSQLYGRKSSILDSLLRLGDEDKK